MYLREPTAVKGHRRYAIGDSRKALYSSEFAREEYFWGRAATARRSVHRRVVHYERREFELNGLRAARGPREYQQQGQQRKRVNLIPVVHRRLLKSGAPLSRSPFRPRPCRNTSSRNKTTRFAPLLAFRSMPALVTSRHRSTLPAFAALPGRIASKRFGSFLC